MCVVFFLILSVGILSSAHAETAFIKFYQTHLSAADGDRCRMTPSCSAYAEKAIETHGLFLGWVMACDRLVRCGRDEAGVSATRMVDGREYIHDPLESNHFWWFENDNIK